MVGGDILTESLRANKLLSKLGRVDIVDEVMVAVEVKGDKRRFWS